ncbi:MAG: LacI family DNA-binding transcriptional regulator [Armatimonadia bacterium]
MHDVADAAGVSLMTVSRVFHRPSQVNAETRDRILEVARQLGYRPNRIARSMVTGRTMTIGVMAETWFAQLLTYVDLAASEHGYSVIYAQVQEESREEQMRRIEGFLEQQVDGVISASTSIATIDHSALHVLCDQGVPLVTFNRYGDELPCSKVFADNCRGGREAVQHLADRGHERIAFVGGSPDHPQRAVQEQIAGYYHAMAAKGLSVDGLQWFGDVAVEGGEELGVQCLRSPARPTAVVAVNDEVAAGVLRAAYGLGLSVPNDLSVIGFDNTAVARCATPALTSVNYPYEAAAREAVRLLLGHIASESMVTTTVFLHRALAERKSCADHPS